MRKGTVFVIAVAATVGAYFAGRAFRDGDAGVTAVDIGDGIERKQVDAEGPSKGPADALITIVEFSEFQCPFCSRVNPTIDKLTKDYPGKIRVVFRHFPLAFHKEAPMASQAAMAAHDQGKFWEMHDKLFANQRALTRPELEKYAQEIGLDMGKFKAALDKETYKAVVDKDFAAGQAVGVQGTPSFFINGRMLVGAQPFEEFKKVVDAELATAQKLIAEKGVSQRKLYATLMASASKTVVAKAGEAAKPSGPSKPNVSDEVYKVTVGRAPVKGGKQPKVTIIAYSEFQCPFCARVLPTLDKVHKTYGDDVQVSFKHFPLGFHQNAAPAAIASIAAQQQGKFWEMHDKLFANQQALEPANLEKFAQEVGLDMGKYKSAIQDPKLKALVDADEKEGANFGVRGTPSFFINGRFFRGAQPYDNFKAVIDEEIKKADAKLKEGVSRGQLYAELIKNGLDKAKEEAPPPGQPGEPQAGVAYKVDASGAPSKGAKDALVTIVQFSDFQCPFCTRVEPTVDKILEEYKGKVRVVWRDQPLSFHQNARPAAMAARAAGEQGKFWEMHKKLFENQKALEAANLETYAQELGLNMAKFKAAMKSDKLAKGIDADVAIASKVGANGTPAFFINGISLSGAQPFERFKSVIDTELAKAEAMVKKGVPKSKIYETIMKSAKAELAAAPAPGQAPPEAGPEADPKVWDVKIGNAPSRGPKDAPITMVIFSDFECPFCTRVEPTLAQVEKEYPGKVRVVWKNYPLPFHNNAKPAAEAAMAAGEQGKFWQMHEKLFQNQKALDRTSLDKYAQEIGLDMGKFKAAMESKKFAAVIDADMKEAATVEVNGTPATFVNGRKIEGAHPFDTFKKVVDQELAKLGPGKKRKVAVN